VCVLWVGLPGACFSFFLLATRVRNKRRLMQLRMRCIIQMLPRRVLFAHSVVVVVVVGFCRS
jgi:hypothetical protein